MRMCIGFSRSRKRLPILTMRNPKERSPLNTAKASNSIETSSGVHDSSRKLQNSLFISSQYPEFPASQSDRACPLLYPEIRDQAATAHAASRSCEVVRSRHCRRREFE